MFVHNLAAQASWLQQLMKAVLGPISQRVCDNRMIDINRSSMAKLAINRNPF